MFAFVHPPLKHPRPLAPSEPDPDPDGAKLAATPDPLGEASKLVDMLVRHAGNRRDSHVLAAEVALRKGRLVVALGAVRKAAEVAEGGVGHAEVHGLALRLALAGERGYDARRCVSESGARFVL